MCQRALAPVLVLARHCLLVAIGPADGRATRSVSLGALPHSHVVRPSAPAARSRVRTRASDFTHVHAVRDAMARWADSDAGCLPAFGQYLTTRRPRGHDFLNEEPVRSHRARCPRVTVCTLQSGSSGTRMQRRGSFCETAQERGEARGAEYITRTPPPALLSRVNLKKNSQKTS